MIPPEFIEPGSELASIYYSLAFTDVGKPDSILRSIDLNQTVLRDSNVLHWREMAGGKGWRIDYHPVERELEGWTAPLLEG